MARWGRGPNRSFGHVHNWQMRTNSAQDTWEISIDPVTGWHGFWINRWWECIRGGKVKHISPSKEYPYPTNLFGRRWNEDFPEPFETKVFLAMSGSPYYVEDPY